MKRLPALIVVLIVLMAGHAAAQGSPRLHTGEQEIAEARAQAALAITDPLAVLAFVLRSVPDRAEVHPTENYYYFRFVHAGVSYTGNIRLAAADRDQGKLHFAYGEAPSDWRPAPAVRYVVLDGSNDVAVERVSGLEYRVTHAGRAVTFVLNDLAAVKPPVGLLRTDERFLGTIFDESALRFFLVFNARLRVFHYLLDETVPLADELVPSDAGKAIRIGRRTGFAFYDDAGRQVLVGVNARHSRLNTFFDGPFDQLPENAIEDEALREAIAAADPAVKGKIDRLGNFADGAGRYLIHPYLLYSRTEELALFQHCMGVVVPARRPLCLVVDDSEQERSNPRPRALTRR